MLTPQRHGWAVTALPSLTIMAEITFDVRPAPVEIALDASIPRLRVTLREGATGQGVAMELSQLYLDRPELAYVDKLYDLTRYPGVVTHADLLLIVDAYKKANTDPRHPCRTAFVTHDPYFGLWAKAMGHLFPGREHLAFTTFADAEAFLDQPMAERRPYVPA